MLAIRLMRMGAKKRPFYRIVVIDSKKPRESKTKEIIGHYNPLNEPPDINLDIKRIQFWLEKGAKTSKTVQSLINRVTKSEKLSD